MTFSFFGGSFAYVFVFGLLAGLWKESSPLVLSSLRVLIVAVVLCLGTIPAC